MCQCHLLMHLRWQISNRVWVPLNLNSDVPSLNLQKLHPTTASMNLLPQSQLAKMRTTWLSFTKRYTPVLKVPWAHLPSRILMMDWALAAVWMVCWKLVWRVTKTLMVMPFDIQWVMLYAFLTFNTWTCFLLSLVPAVVVWSDCSDMSNNRGCNMKEQVEWESLSSDMLMLENAIWINRL